MTQFRSKSNLMFGIIVLAAVCVISIPTLIKACSNRVNVFAVVMLALILIASIAVFLYGMQKIVINEKGVAVSILKVPVKELAWVEIKEAGIGGEKINKNTTMKQLYVSKRQLLESEYQNLDSLRFSAMTIWFDYSKEAEEKIGFYIMQNKSND